MEPRLLNRAGDEASKGGSRGGNGGWTRRSPSEVWYCGQRRNQCKCGSCDGRCGPANGCPCDDCFVLMEARGAKVNRAGHVAIKGGSRGGHGGWTGRSPSEVWYCGQRKNQCKCGSCDGRCDLPTDVLAMIVMISCIQAMALGVSTRIRPPPGGSCKVHQCRAGSMATVARIDTTAYRPASSVRSACRECVDAPPALPAPVRMPFLRQCRQYLPRVSCPDPAAPSRLPMRSSQSVQDDAC